MASELPRIPPINRFTRADMNEDGFKATPGGYDILPPDADTLLHYLGVLDAAPAAQRAALAELFLLPMAQSIPLFLQEELIELGLLAEVGGWAAKGIHRRTDLPDDFEIDLT